MYMTRAEFLRLLAGSAASGALVGCGRDKDATGDKRPAPSRDSRAYAGTKPNVLLITLDTTRADRLSCYGHDRPTSPRLDSLAADGVRFDMAIAQSALTPISHASILTGLNPYEHGIRVLNGIHRYRLDEGVTTLAQSLGGAGYATGGFISAFPASARYGLDRGFATFQPGFDMGYAEARSAERGNLSVVEPRAQCRADVTTDNVLSWLKAQSGPFFAWVHYFDPHDERLVPPPGATPVFAPRGATEGDAYQALYEREICYMDIQIGRLFDALKADGRFDSTLTIAVADHGEGLGDHDWWRHGILYQEQIRVPLLMRGPGIPVGRVVPDMVRTIDIAPTIAEAVGLAPAPPVTGRSVLPLLRGEHDAEPRLAYSDLVDLQIPWQNARARANLAPECLYCVTDGRWKLIWHQHAEEESELYQLATDPGEAHNVIREHPDECRRLMHELMRRVGSSDRLNPTLGTA